VGVRRTPGALATALALAVTPALAAPALAAAPAPGDFTGTTSQRHQGQRGTVHATVAPGGRSLSTLVVDALLDCGAAAPDVRTFTATDVVVSARGTFTTRATFAQPATSADGRAVTARFTTRLKGGFASPRRITGTLHAAAAFEVGGAVYATCRSGEIRFSGSAPRAVAAP
jgi:hypothetical protein